MCMVICDHIHIIIISMFPKMGKSCNSESKVEMETSAILGLWQTI